MYVCTYLRRHDTHSVLFIDFLSFFHFLLDSTPVNGESELKKDVVETGENPRMVSQKQSNDHTASSPIR